MKKLFAFISVSLIAAAAMFAEVTVKKVDGGKLEATFFYGNPRAAEVLLAGDFTSWQDGALPMTKTDKGFTLTKVFDAGTTLKYKFISDGSWTTDLRAPDFVDDGFGGKNGLAELDSLAGGEEAVAAAPKIKFLTWSMLGAQAKFLLNDDTANELDKGLLSAGINLKSYIKFSGDVLPKVPMYVEMAVAEQDTFENLYKQGELEWKDGLNKFGVGILNAPVDFFNGGAANATYLGHFKFGISSDWINWTTGYKYAKLPPHQINSWITVDKEWEAGYGAVGGFNYFELGPRLQQLGPVSLKAAIAPNKSADRKGEQYGFFGWVNASVGPVATVDFQYNAALGKTFDTLFGHCYEQDFIVGYKGIFGPVTARANYLVNLYGDGDLVKIAGVVKKTKFSPAASDVGAVDPKASALTNMAATADVNFSNDVVNAVVGARFRGKQAGLMYVEQGADDHTNLSDKLGKLNHFRAWFNVNANVTTALNIGLKPYVEMTLDKALKPRFKDKDTLKIYAKPYFAFDLNKELNIPGKLDGYAEFAYFTKEKDKVSSVIGKNQFRFETLGVKYAMDLTELVKGFEIIYCYDDSDGDKLFNTVISTIKLDNDYNVQAGFGVRTKNKEAKADINNPFGFYVGAFKKLPVLAKPTAYVQFVYAMDPFNGFGDGPTAYNLSDYKLDKGVSNYEDNTAVRIGLHWDL